MENKAIVIVGSTCTGKTSLTLDLCKEFTGAIVSADSRQVVRRMDIGTGKVPISATYRPIKEHVDRWIIDGVDIFGYDLVSPDEYFSAFDFKNYCEKLFPRISRDGKHIFLVGGTGFYIDAVCEKINLDGGGPNMTLRQELEKLPIDKLAEELLCLDEGVFKTTDIKNPVRLIRAIEKATQRNDFGNEDRNSNQEKFELNKKNREKNPQQIITPVIYIGLTASREVLYSRADSWIDEVFSENLFEEVRQIQKQFPKSPRLKGLIYKSAVSYLSKETALEEARQRAKFDIHAYIRRQQTWFKRNPQIKWFDITSPNFDVEVSFLVESVLNGQR